MLPGFRHVFGLVGGGCVDRETGGYRGEAEMLEVGVAAARLADISGDLLTRECARLASIPVNARRVHAEV